jgi:murein DD-endopeptidase MepM/ murein hydrolase activator NlpD
VDFVDHYGELVMAAVDDIVVRLRNAPATNPYSSACGLGIVIMHNWSDQVTSYCHLSSINVEQNQNAQRGQIIGRVGTSGFRRLPRKSIPHVHMNYLVNIGHVDDADKHFQATGKPCSLSDVLTVARREESDIWWELTNPLAPEVDAGCFDPEKEYPSDWLVLTYRGECR